MASILNKSTHPVHVKKVSLTTWKLRDEIEYIISKRVTDSDETPNIEDIKEYFSSDGELQKEKPQDFERMIPEGKTIPGQMILSDINMQSVLIFAEDGFTPGQNIGITFNIPNSFILTARVDSCTNLGRKSRVISNKKFHFRISCVFEFKYESQKDSLRNFLKSVEPEIPPGPANIKSPKSSEEEDDDFSDLGI